MTASKSSRARAARAASRASAASATASSGTAVKDRDRTPARSGQARAGQVPAGQARAAAGRAARTAVTEDDPGQRGPALWMQLTTFVLSPAGLGVSIYLAIAHFTQPALAEIRHAHV